MTKNMAEEMLPVQLIVDALRHAGPRQVLEVVEKGFTAWGMHEGDKVAMFLREFWQGRYGGQ